MFVFIIFIMHSCYFEDYYYKFFNILIPSFVDQAEELEGYNKSFYMRLTWVGQALWT